MSLRNTIIIVVLLILIGGYALYQNHQTPPEQTPKLYTISAKNIEKIDLRSPDRDIVLERGAGDNWKIVKPIKAESEHIAVNSLADQIAGVQITGTAEEHPSNLAPFGLAVPAVTITVTMKGGKTLPSILVGKQAPIGNSVFVKTSDKPAILLVASSFGAEVNKHVDDLRSRNVFSIKPEDTRKIVITRSGAPTVELTRDHNQWKFVQPRNYPADNDAVNTLLRGLTNARVSQFIDDHPADLSKYGLASPSMTIELEGANGKPVQTLRVGFRQPNAESDTTYARSTDGSNSPVYTITNDVVSAANKGFDDLRDKIVLSFNPADVSRATIVGGPIDETLNRVAKDKWTISVAGKTATAETPVVDSLLDQLHQLKASSIIADSMNDPSRYGMLKPTLIITLYAGNDREIDALRTSILQTITRAQTSDEKPKMQNIGYATTSRDGTVYEISSQSIIDLENTTNRLHSDVAATPAPLPTGGASPGMQSLIPSAAASH
jgi:hypothetical protein